jgi:hypothetical protein
MSPAENCATNETATQFQAPRTQAAVERRLQNCDFIWTNWFFYTKNDQCAKIYLSPQMKQGAEHANCFYLLKRWVTSAKRLHSSLFFAAQ